MQVTEIVTVITTCGAVICSFVVYLQSTKVSAIQTEAGRAIEQIKGAAAIALEQVKASAVKRQKALEMATAESAAVEKVLRDAWQMLQACKETADVATRSPKEGTFAAFELV
jgi:hypothetical protein